MRLGHQRSERPPPRSPQNIPRSHPPPPLPASAFPSYTGGNVSTGFNGGLVDWARILAGFRGGGLRSGPYSDRSIPAAGNRDGGRKAGAIWRYQRAARDPVGMSEVKI